jgi:Holliday junction resolvase-like predicted endonuclease
MLTENDVVQAVVGHLESKGYQIVSALTTSQQGIDIVAEHPLTKKRLLVEAKGGTSSKEGTANYGNPFTSNQAKTHVSVAFYYAAMLQQKHEGAEVALAFPLDETHRALVKSISSALKLLGVSVYFVDCSRGVTVLQ